MGHSGSFPRGASPDGHPAPGEAGDGQRPGRFTVTVKGDELTLKGPCGREIKDRRLR
jgi:hypothetical protein